MKSRSGFARIAVAACCGIWCLPLGAEPPHRRSGGGHGKKRISEAPPVQADKGDPAKQGEAKDGLCKPPPVPKGFKVTVSEDEYRADRQIHANHSEIAKRLDAAAAALDEAERHAAEWGHASIASAVLVKSVGAAKPFAIGVDREKYGYEHYEQKVRQSVQGAAARTYERFIGARAEVRAGQDLGLMREGQIAEIQQQTRMLDAIAERKKAEARLNELNKPAVTEKPTNKPDPKSNVSTEEDGDQDAEDEDSEDTSGNGASSALLPSLTSTVVKDNQIDNLFVESDFADPGELLGTARKKDDASADAGGKDAAGAAAAPDLETLALVADELSLSEGDILKTAGSNVVTRNILNYLTDPAEPGANNVPWFMVTQVSVSPGTRTWKDYVAETTLHPYYATLDCGNVKANLDPNTVHPGIFAAFPLVEAQALDLRNSERFETRLSFALAAKLIAQGKEAEAKFFLEKVTKTQQDIATRTQLPIVVPSSNGREVTYRFDPGLQGLIEPGNRKKGSGMVLNANSVPALIVIMTDRKSLEKYTHLHFDLHTRWIPKKRASLWSSTWDGLSKNYNSRVGMEPSDVIAAASALDTAAAHLDWADHFKVDRVENGTTATGFRSALNQARMRYSALISKLGSTSSNVGLPLHYNIQPALFTPDNDLEQSIYLDRFSGLHPEFCFGDMNLITLGNNYFFEKALYESSRARLKAELSDAIEEQKKTAKTLHDALVKLSGELKEESDKKWKQVGEENNELARILDERREPKRQGGVVDRVLDKLLGDQVVPPVLAPVVPPAPAPGDDPETPSRIAAELSRYADILASSEEAYPTVVQSISRWQDYHIYVGVDNKKIISNLSVEGLEAFLRAGEKKVKAGSDLARMGYFTKVGVAAASVTMPKDFTGTFAEGNLPVIGHITKETSTSLDGIEFGKIELEHSFDFGDLQVGKPLAVVAESIVGGVIPNPIPTSGHVITVKGKNLSQVRCAYFSSSRQKLKIISRGHDSIQLGLSLAPPGEKHVILSDSPEPPSLGLETRNLEIIPITVLTKEDAQFTVTTEAVEVLASSPVLRVEGAFPEGVSAMIEVDPLSNPAIVSVNAGRTVLSIALGPDMFPSDPKSPTKGVLHLKSSNGKQTAKIPISLREDRVAVEGAFPSVIPAGKLPKELTVLGRFHTSLGNQAMVLIGGLSLGTHTVVDGRSITVTGLDSLSAEQLAVLDEKVDLVLFIGGKAFTSRKAITIVPKPKS